MNTAEIADPGPFLIDGPEYSDRDREMFVLGYEFCHVVRAARSVRDRDSRMTIHVANSGRARMACDAAARDCRVELLDGEGGWCELVIPRESR